MNKTNTGLVNYCKAQLGRPYWMGTFGQISTANLYYYNRNRLPQFYTANNFMEQVGQRVHDCIGLIKGYLWSAYADSVPEYASNGCPDTDADTMLRLCRERGAIGSIPELPGTLVFSKGHVGVYIGGGEVIEARGHAYGVVQTKLKDRGWTSWGKCPYITYESEDEEMSYEQFKEFMAQYEIEVRAKPEPKWSIDEGGWKKANELGVVNGAAPEAAIKRCEVTAIMDRLGLLK